MEEKKENAPVIASSLPPCCYQQQGGYRDDEINLVDLWLVLVRRWQWIAVVMALVVGAAVVYLLITTPIYEAEAVLLPPEDRHVQALNIPGINEINIEATRKEIYQEFISALKSRSLRWQFFSENNLISALGGDQPSSAEMVFRQRFNEPLRVNEGARDQAGRVFVSLQGVNPELISGWTNDFIQLAARSSIDKYIEGISTKIANEKETLQEQIRIDREFAQQRRWDRLAVLDEQITIAREKQNRQDRISRLEEQITIAREQYRREDRIAQLEEKIAIAREQVRRQDRIALLEEQIAIARELNIMTRTDAPLRAVEGSGFGIAVSTAGEPLYLRGVKDLTAEKEALEKREDDDPFIPGLRDLIAELEILQKREDHDPFIPGLRDLIAELEVLQKREDDDPFIPGLRELLAEQELLRQREDDDPFIDGLRDKQIKLDRLDSGLRMLQTARAEIAPARLDQKALPPGHPVQPNKKLILALSLVLGGMLGVFGAFFVEFIAKARRPQ